MQYEAHSVEEILRAAQEITSKVPNCWAVTGDQQGGANARVVQPFFSQLEREGWIVRFLASARSRKAAEIARSGSLTLAYFYDPELASVALAGGARIIDYRAYLQKHWRREWDVFFRTGSSDADAIFVELAVERIELFSLRRSIAAPPTGSRAATLRRTQSGSWQIA